MNLVEIIKKAALEAVNASKPTDIVEGTVISSSPLKIQVSQMNILDSTFLVLTDSVVDRYVKATADWQNTDKVETKNIKLHNALKKGEKVVMLRAQGGQRFYVLGRLT